MSTQITPEAEVTQALPMTDLVAALKAAAEPTRLRILVLLSRSELSVKDLTQILGQSQPRLSRHLKLLTEAGLIERFRDGSWVYFHVSDRTAGGHLARRLIAAVEGSDAQARRDRDRLDALKRDREQSAQAYFKTHAADWDRIRSLYVPEAAVEKAMLAALAMVPSASSSIWAPAPAAFSISSPVATSAAWALTSISRCWRMRRASSPPQATATPRSATAISTT